MLDKLGSAKQGTSGVAKGLEGAALGDVGEKNTYSVSRKGKKEKTKQTKQNQKPLKKKKKKKDTLKGCCYL